MPPVWKVESSRCGNQLPQCIIYKDHTSLFVNHFTDYVVTDEDGKENKRLGIAVYASKVDSLDAEQHIRVYLFNDHEPAEQVRH